MPPPLEAQIQELHHNLAIQGSFLLNTADHGANTGEKVDTIEDRLDELRANLSILLKLIGVPYRLLSSGSPVESVSVIDSQELNALVEGVQLLSLNPSLSGQRYH